MTNFNYLVIANVGSARIDNVEKRGVSPFFHKTMAIAIAWGDWYNENPFNGMRDIRLITYGGLELCNLRISDFQFESREKAMPQRVPIFIRENKMEHFRFVKGYKVELTEDFHFTDGTSCDLFVHDIKISMGRSDDSQPFELINWHGGCCFGGDDERYWIAPYDRHPNRPFVEWGRNPNSRSY